MEYNKFLEKMKEYSAKINIKLNDEQIEKFYKYMNLLIEWNQKMNLTAIIEPNEIIIKHFIDSLTAKKYIKDNSYVLDIGTGAGFPGIPLCICMPDTKFVLADSLNKRITFLAEVKDKLNLENVELIHTRAEELGKNKEYREKFDYTVSRAVASLSVLLEYTVPFIKINGQGICLKGSNIKDELEESKKAMNILGVEIERIDNFDLPCTDYERNIIVLKKIKNTPNKFPRKSGTPSKEPLKN